MAIAKIEPDEPMPISGPLKVPSVIKFAYRDTLQLTVKNGLKKAKMLELQWESVQNLPA